MLSFPSELPTPRFGAIGGDCHDKQTSSLCVKLALLTIESPERQALAQPLASDLHLRKHPTHGPVSMTRDLPNTISYFRQAHVLKSVSALVSLNEHRPETKLRKRNSFKQPRNP